MPAIILDVLVPNIKLGFITVSAARMPIAGVTLADIFGPLLVEDPRTVLEGTAGSWEAFRVGLAEGQGLDLPLPQGTRAGFFNDQGVLVVTVPHLARSILDGWTAYQVQRPVIDGQNITGRFRVQRGLRGSVTVMGKTIEIRAPE